MAVGQKWALIEQVRGLVGDGLLPALSIDSRSHWSRRLCEDHILRVHLLAGREPNPN